MPDPRVGRHADKNLTAPDHARTEGPAGEEGFHHASRADADRSIDGAHNSAEIEIQVRTFTFETGRRANLQVCVGRQKPVGLTGLRHNEA